MRIQTHNSRALKQNGAGCKLLSLRGRLAGRGNPEAQFTRRLFGGQRPHNPPSYFSTNSERAEK